MRNELFWDYNNPGAELEIQRAINFGGFDYIDYVQEKYGMERFKNTLINNRNLSRKAVNYWCMVLNLDRSITRSYQTENIWEPTR
ncbi:hypothetical protein [Desulfonatronovibrio magnus]|uniref:hypothetical protein n=1 Tax=Desulfonatronovibrio magnus TaxID=698827 RepID=UPI0005EB8B18|nr:hypothetical protein [Desulfonatronovibrio magnus]